MILLLNMDTEHNYLDILKQCIKSNDEKQFITILEKINPDLLNDIDNKGNTISHLATSWRRKKFFSLLENKEGINMTIKNKYGYTPYDLIKLNNPEKILKLEKKLYECSICGCNRYFQNFENKVFLVCDECTVYWVDLDDNPIWKYTTSFLHWIREEDKDFVGKGKWTTEEELKLLGYNKYIGVYALVYK